MQNILSTICQAQYLLQLICRTLDVTNNISPYKFRDSQLRELFFWFYDIVKFLPVYLSDSVKKPDTIGQTPKMTPRSAATHASESGLISK